MSALRQAAQQALEFIRVMNNHGWMLADYEDDSKRVVKDLEDALAEPVQEPVALDWLHKWANQDNGEPETQWHEGYEAARRVVQIHLTTPPQRPAEPVQEPGGCDYCNQPLYAAVKCRVCGRVTTQR